MKNLRTDIWKNLRTDIIMVKRVRAKNKKAPPALISSFNTCEKKKKKSVLFYSLTTVPVRRSYIQRLQKFVVDCYKRMLGIDRKLKISEKTLTQIMNTKSIEKIWNDRRMTSYSHIARLPYDNPARIVLFGRMENDTYKQKRKHFNLKRNMMKDIRQFMDTETFCNLCDRKIRSTDLYRYKRANTWWVLY